MKGEICLQIEGMSCSGCVNTIKDKLYGTDTLWRKLRRFFLYPIRAWNSVGLDMTEKEKAWAKFTEEDAKQKLLVSAVSIDLVTKTANMTPMPGVEVSDIITAIESLEYKAKIVETKNDSDPLFFHIPGMVSAGDEITLKALLLNQELANNVVIDFSTRKARIIPTRGIKGQYIRRFLNDKNPALNATLIADKQEETLYFSLKNLTSPALADDLKQKLRSKVAYIKNCEVKFETKTLTLVVPIADKDKDKNMICKKILSDIASTHLGIEAQDVTPPKQKKASDSYQTFLRGAALNGAVAVLLAFFSGFIPLPITPWGQLFGIGLGILNLAVMWWTGKEFYKEAWKALITNGRSTMDTMIALGTGSAWIYSMVLILIPGFFPVVALQYQFLAIQMILGILNLGRAAKTHLEEQHKEDIGNSSNMYVDMLTKIACRKRGDLLEEIPYTEIKEGDILQVKTGERFAVEGCIINHVETEVEQTVLSGESTPGVKRKGDKVIAGSLNLGPMVEIKALIDGTKGSIHQLNDILVNVDNTEQNRKISHSRYVDKIAEYFVPIILSIAALSALGWFLIGPTPALPWMWKSFTSVLLCACPCAIGLATPFSMTISMFKLAERGIRPRNATAIESMASVNTVAWDKTGTLSNPIIGEIYAPFKEFSQDDIFLLAASVEQNFHDPYAESFKKENMNLVRCEDAEKGEKGVTGTVNGKKISVGNAVQLKLWGISIDEKLLKKEKEFTEQGLNTLYVSIDGVCRAVVSLKYDARSDAASDISSLRELGIKNIMITGDRETIARRLASKVGIQQEDVYAELNSDQKEELIHCLNLGFQPDARFFRLDKNERDQLVENRKLNEKHMQEKYVDHPLKNLILDIHKTARRTKPLHVAMVGDGINDLKAFRKADVSIAAGLGTYVSEHTQFALHQLNVNELVKIARVTMKNVHQNLIWTFFYNTFSLISATGLLYPLFKFVLPPVIASLSMGISSVFNVFNSSRLPYLIDRALEVKPRQQNRFMNFINASLDFVWSFQLRNSMEIFFSFIWGAKKKPPASPKRQANESPEGEKLLVFENGQHVEVNFSKRHRQLRNPGAKRELIFDSPEKSISPESQTPSL